MRRIVTALTVVIAGAAVSLPGAAEEIVWGPVEVVDAPVSVISPNGSSPLEQLLDDWYVAYAKDGDIWIRVRTEAGWLSPEQLTDDPAIARSPQLASAESYYWGAHRLLLVWEDERTGHPEVWTKILVDGVWSDGECLSCDDDPSRRPAIDAEKSGNSPGAVVAWVDDGVGGASIQARIYDDGVWTPAYAVSGAGGDVGEPTVHADGRHDVVWRSTGPSGSTLASRYWIMSSGGWGDIESDLVPTDAGYPNTSRSFFYRSIIFEYQPLPDMEINVFLEPGLRRVSGYDGVDSVRPQTAPYFYRINYWEEYGGYEREWHAWTNLVGSSRVHMFGNGNDDASALGVGLDNVALTARDAHPPEDIYADFLAAYIELVDEVPTLVVRQAQTVGCEHWVVGQPPAFLISPEGWENAFTLTDACNPDQILYALFVLNFDPELLEALTWSLDQDIDHFITDFIHGEASFSLLGGGCSQAGSLRAYISSMYQTLYSGVKSPDVNGDCVVDTADRDYVETAQGTDDYCGDLDGSGLVDAADLAIVDATFGDECISATTGLPNGAAVARSILRAVPNPTTGGTRLWLDDVGEHAVEVEMFDVAGRAVRRFVDVPRAGDARVVEWDLTDVSGRRVSPGVYFVRARIGDELRHLRLNVIR